VGRLGTVEAVGSGIGAFSLEVGSREGSRARVGTTGGSVTLAPGPGLVLPSIGLRLLRDAWLETLLSCFAEGVTQKGK